MLEGAELDGNGRAALYGDSLTVRSEVFVCLDISTGQARPFRATGSVRLLGARFTGDLDLGGAQLTVAGEPARPARAGDDWLKEASISPVASAPLAKSG